MKQLFQNLRTGLAETFEVPSPVCPPGFLVIESRCSLLSPGTERMLADFGKAGWIAKARQQPEKVRQTIKKAQTDGLHATVKAVFSKLEQPLPVGYSNVGRVIAVGEDVEGFALGDRVVSNGYHAEAVCVPPNLCAKIPDTVSDEEAAFTVLGAISLQGVRLLEPTLGETFVVYGLGLIGVLGAQILKANGCRVIGLDISEERAEFARQLGIDALAISPGVDPAEAVLRFNNRREVDGVLLAASTASNEPIQAAPRMCRQKGRIVLVGVVGLSLERTEFFKKEITFRVSCSYGPGRYEPGYETEGLDYPIGYVRWTEQRNFEAVLELLRAKSLYVRPLISERVPFSEPAAAYNRILSEGKGFGFLFEYPGGDLAHRVELMQKDSRPILSPGAPVIGVIGGGSYARGMLLPAFAKAGASFSGLAARSGTGGADLVRKYGFQFHSTETLDVLKDPSTTAVIVATRHDSHAELALRALSVGKHVFVEKPLGLTRDEVKAVKEAHWRAPSLALMVGFNRRYSPFARKMKELLSDRKEPISVSIVVNAGSIDKKHWIYDEKAGGGRVIGEMCHFIDLALFLVGSSPEKVTALPLGHATKFADIDSVAASLSFPDGSLATIQYLANGHKSLPKERVEVFSSGRVLVLDNFRTLKAHGFGAFKGKSSWSQDKGQLAEAALFLELIQGKSRELTNVTDSGFESMEATFKVADALGRS